MRSVTTVVFLLLLASPAIAQEPDAGGEDRVVGGVRWLYETVRGYITRSAEQVPEELYGYRPTPEVRSFGEILGHVANAGYAFCSAALGEERPNAGDAEQLASKAELIAALEASFAYCDRAYALDDAAALATATVFGQTRSRIFALEFNAAHDFEHYGNLVTYMRANGLVPPSSQGQGD